MTTVTVLINGKKAFCRVVDTVECEETAGGTLDLHATFPPIDMSDGLPTGTLLDGNINFL